MSQPERVFRMTLAYDGSSYAGWQYQPDQPTIQGTLEQALRQITGRQVRVLASGRTDAGVHAQGQVASFRVATRLKPTVLHRALNAATPDDIHVWHVSHAPPTFHPIRDAIAKTYQYTLVDNAQRDVFVRRYAWHLPQRLDVPAMRAAAVCLRGRHDFRSFEATGAPRRSTVRTVRLLDVRRRVATCLDPVVVVIRADGFLYNMVRNIVGTLVQVGRGREQPEWVDEVLRSGDRRRAGPTAPPEGLVLWRVDYRD